MNGGNLITVDDVGAGGGGGGGGGGGDDELGAGPIVSLVLLALAAVAATAVGVFICAGRQTVLRYSLNLQLSTSERPIIRKERGLPGY